MPNQDIVFLASSSLVSNQNVVTAMKPYRCQRLIVARRPWIDDEGCRQVWQLECADDGRLHHANRLQGDFRQRLSHHYLRMTWLYDENGNEMASNRAEGQPLRGTRVTSSSGEVSDCHRGQPSLYQYANIGVVEPGLSGTNHRFIKVA